MKMHFISSSLISLNSEGELGIKIIKESEVKFILIEIISDKGNGYWISKKIIMILNKFLIITQGSEYVIDGEKVNFKVDEDG